MILAAYRISRQGESMSGVSPYRTGTRPRAACYFLARAAQNPTKFRIMSLAVFSFQ